MNNKTHTMILVSLFTALTAVGAFYKIPLPPVPFTLQIFFVIFAGLLLSPKAAFASQAIYIAVGLVGFPVFAGGGGPQYIFNPSFGYLIGFAFAAFTVGLVSKKLTVSGATFAKFFIASLSGLLVIYFVGVPYLFLIMKYVSHASVTASGIIIKGFLLFLPWDIVKIALASLLAVQVYSRIEVYRNQKT